jgi:PAS domain S-box-containing protein
MTWLNLPTVIVSSVAAIVSASIAVYAWRRRDAPGGVYFALLMLMAAEWAFVNTAEFVSIGVSTKIWWSKLSYIGIVNISPLWFLFALSYSQRVNWYKQLRVISLWIVPLLIFVLVLTNEQHGLIWSSILPISDQAGARLIYKHGPAFWGGAAYFYLLLLLGTAILVRATLLSSHLYRQQVAMLLAGVAIPWLGNVVYLTGLDPLPGLDLTPIAFSLTGILVTWSIFRFHVFEVVPIARETVIENLNEGVLVLDEQDRVLDINPTARRMVEACLEEVIGKPAETALARWPVLVEYIHASLPAKGEFPIFESLWLDIYVSPLYNEQGELAGRLVVLRDITRRKQAETSLQQYTYELESRNAELDAFAHTVAHDLKNPINVMLTASSMLQTYAARLEEEQTQEILQTIERTASKMVNIVNELLLLASVRKVDQVDIKPLDMERIVSEALARLVDLSAESHAQIRMPDFWPIAIGHAPWVEEVWVNYISNALKYGGRLPCIELGYDEPSEAQAGELAGNQVRFWVQDNGPGLSPEDQAKLFVEFGRLDEHRVKGHGLGLSIVRRIVNKLGGQVGVESQEGQGSKFYFTLPAPPEKEEGQQPNT